MQAFEINGKRHLPAKHVLLRFLTTSFVFLVMRLFQITAGLNWKHVKSHEEMRGNVASGGFDQSLSRSPYLISKRFAGLKIYALLLLLGGMLSFDAGAQTTYTLTGIGSANGWNRNQFPIMFGNTCSRTTQLFKKAKLNGGGIPSSGTVELAKIAWHPDLSRNIAGTLTIYMKHRPSSAGEITTASWDLTGAVTVYSGTVSHVLAQGVWWEVPFTTNFTWNNTDDIQILVEYTRTSTVNQSSGNAWRGYDGNEPANTTAFNVGVSCPTTLNATFSPNKKFYDTRLTTAGSSPLAVGTIAAIQQTGVVTKGGTKQGILKIDIPTSGSTGTQTLNSVTVTTANTNNADIAAGGVKLWVGSTLATATQLGSGQNAAATVTFSGLSQSISGATTSLWVTYDIASGATLGNFVDAQIASGGITITAAGGATAPGTQPASTLNPAGNRKIDYCNDLYTIGCGSLGIGDVSIGTAGSILNQTATGCTGGLTFADFTAISGISMSAGSTYPVNITDVENFIPIYSAGIGIWIDLNQNGSFGDAGELIGSIANQQGPWAFNITVPAGASSGTYRMRIKATENVSQSLGSSCSKDNGGETHDYLVTISGGASCTSPSGTTATFSAFSSVSSSSITANVNYPNSVGATGYILLRNTSNTAPTAPASGTAVPTTAGNTVSWGGTYTYIGSTTTLGSAVAFTDNYSLSASTTYYYWVVAYQNTNGPCWFTPVTQANNSQATTVACVAPATPSTPTGSQTGVCSGSQYTYSVTAVAGATSYDWTLPPGWTATSTTTSTNSITATAGSSGYLSVRANNCGGSSAYSSNLGISVTTSPTISFPEGQTVYTGCRILITPNPSSPSFSLSGGIGTSSSGGVTYLTGSSVMASSVQATSGGCSSPVYTITVTAGITNRGTLASGDQTICDGQTPNSIGYSTAATGTGITYQWYYKNTNATCPTTNEATTAWTIIGGAQSNSYSPAQGFVPAGSTYTFACYVGSSLGSCGGWSSGCRKITVNSIPSAPTGSASQSFCSAASPTVAALSATGTTIQWYDAASNGNLLSSSAALTNSTSYYASQTVSGCESTSRLAVAVTVTTTPSAPTGSASQSFCSAASPTVAALSATGTAIQWYDAASNGNLLSSSAALTNSTSYYASQTVSGCESTSRLAVVAVVFTNGTWIGGTSSDWNTPANWCDGVPASGTNIMFSVSAGNDLVLDQHRTVGNVNFNGSSKNIVLGAFNLTTSGAISNYSANNYVKSTGAGNLTTTIANGVTYLFPIGNASYNPLSIKNTTGASDVFSVRIQDVVYLNGASGATISTPHVSRTWDISKTNSNAGTGVDLQFNWNTGDVSGTLVDPRMNHHTGNGWEIPTNITSSTAGTNTLAVVGYTGTFSPFAVGEGSSPLPVELVSFHANCTDQGVALTWQTASEHSSAYFDVERSEDSQNWSLLEQVAAAGNSTSLLSYSILDSEIVRKTVYYRLNQVDFDGANKRYNPIYMNCGNMGNVITTYPNPSTDDGFQLLFENSLGERIIGLNILDALGNLVYTKELQLQNGTNTFNVYDFKVETGVYFLQIKEADGVTSLIKHLHFSK